MLAPQRTLERDSRTRLRSQSTNNVIGSPSLVIRDPHHSRYAATFPFHNRRPEVTRYGLDHADGIDYLTHTRDQPLTVICNILGQYPATSRDLEPDVPCSSCASQNEDDMQNDECARAC